LTVWGPSLHAVQDWEWDSTHIRLHGPLRLVSPVSLPSGF